MKNLLIITTIISSLGISSACFGVGNHPKSEDRDVMRAEKPTINSNSHSPTHADKSKDVKLDTRKMKSQIVVGTKATGERYSKETPLSEKVQNNTYHPIKIKRMGDH